MSLTFSLHTGDLETAVRKLRSLPSGLSLRETRNIAISAMGTFVELAMQEAPKGATGDFARSLGYQTKLLPDGIELRHRSGGRAGDAVDYARFVVDGTGVHHRPDPHTGWIVEGFQRFVVDGEEITTMTTYHHGAKPNDLEARAAKRLEGAMSQIMATGGRRILRFVVNA